MEYMILSKNKYLIFRMKKGSISIFLAMIFLSIVLLVSVIAEAARMSAVQAKSTSVSYMASDSVMASYAKQVYEDYGLLLVWEKQKIEDMLLEYVQANIQMADLEVSGNDFMMPDVMKANIKKKILITDSGGDYFVEQVEKYLKYAGLTAVIKKLKNDSGDVEEREIQNNVTDDITTKDSNKMATLVENIDESVSSLKDIANISKALLGAKNAYEKVKTSKNTSKKNWEKLINNFSDLQVALKKKNSSIDNVINLINKYENKKDELLKKTGNKKVKNDYIDQNLTKLKNIRGKINGIESLNVSNATEMNESLLKEIHNALEDSNSIIKSLSELLLSKVTAEDKKNQSIYDSAGDFLTKGVLSLVIGDTKNLSSASIVTSNLPSKTSMSNSENSSELLDNAIIAIYSEIKFGNYIKSKKSHALQYEMEYLVAGKDSDQKNLKSVIERLVLIRNATNLACLMGDEEKMALIETVAASVAAVTGLPFMEPLAKVLLTEAWALAESISDVKALLKGEKLSLIKTKANWKTDLKSLSSSSSKGESNGFEYKRYVQMLMMLTSRDKIVYRAMDLIQLNICKSYNQEFRMNKCFVEFKAQIEYKAAPLFASMPWSVGLTKDGGGYRYSVACSNNY